jgi:hypothetical protein
MHENGHVAGAFIHFAVFLCDACFSSHVSNATTDAAHAQLKDLASTAQRNVSCSPISAMLPRPCLVICRPERHDKTRITNIASPAVRNDRSFL